MYITNNVNVAILAEKSGIDRIFIDMEYIGKSDRQGGMDTVQSYHTIEDIESIREVITESELLVRCNPIHDATEEYCSSEEEINRIIQAGADIIMLPYFKTVEEVEIFLNLVDGRAKTIPLVETPEAVALIDEILELDGIDEIFVGLNDLSLGYKKSFMFELLSDGTVEYLCNRFERKGIPYGFGGIASIGKGLLSAEYVIGEHYRLGSTSVILSRCFCDLRKIKELKEVEWILQNGVKEIREYEEYCRCQDFLFFENNQEVTEHIIHSITRRLIAK